MRQLMDLTGRRVGMLVVRRRERAIAFSYGVNHSTIIAIKSRRTWRHIIPESGHAAS